MIWTQFFGLTSVLIGLYVSAESKAGSGSMIALVSAVLFGLVLVGRTIYFNKTENLNP